VRRGGVALLAIVTLAPRYSNGCVLRRLLGVFQAVGNNYPLWALRR